VFRNGRSADDQIGLEFDRELDEFVVRFAALPLSLNTPVPPSEGTMAMLTNTGRYALAGETAVLSKRGRPLFRTVLWVISGSDGCRRKNRLEAASTADLARKKRKWMLGSS